MTEEKLKEAELTEKNENSDVVDKVLPVTGGTAVQSDEKSGDVSKVLETESQKVSEKEEKVHDETDDEFEHAERKESETEKKGEKGAENSENYKGVYECALTTVDNPFNPLQNFDEWFKFDEEKGYHSSSYLSRIAQINDEMSEEEALREIERAIDEIIKYDFMNIYKKVRQPAE